MGSAFLQKNMAALKAHRPELYGKMTACQDSPEIEVFSSYSGLPSLRVGGLHFHSSYNPHQEAGYLVDKIEVRGVDLVVVLGFGLGYHVKRLWSNPYFKGKILVVEQDSRIFKKALECSDLENIIADPAVTLIVEEDVRKVIETISNGNLFVLNMVGVEMIIHPPSIQAHQLFYLDVLKTVRGMLSFAICSFGTVKLFQDIWQENSVENLVDIATHPWIKELIGCARGKPAIVVSAGPSLDNDLEELKKVAGKIPIIAVGTVLAPLMRAGIEPDFVVIADGHDKVRRQFEGVTIPGKTHLLATDYVRKEITDLFRPNVFFYSCSPNPFPSLLPLALRGTEKVFAGGSVAHAAVDIAVLMGFSTVILLGQDLSFSKQRTHAKGTMWEDQEVVGYESEEEFKAKALVWLKGNYEEKVLSSQVFYTFLGSMERYIKTHPEVTFINCTSGGAYINGTVLRTLKEAGEEYARGDVAEDIFPLIEDAKKRISPDLEDLRLNIERAREQMKVILEDLEEGYEKAKVLRNYLLEGKVLSKEEIRDIAASLDGLGRKLEENPYIRLLRYGKGYYKFTVLEMEMKTAATNLERQRKICEAAHEIYEGFLESAKFISEKFGEILEREALWPKTASIN